MKLKINPEYLRNHFFVTILMAVLGGWFGYDGLVKYPSMSGEALYESIEKSKPVEGIDLEAFKTQKIQTQYSFMFFALLVSTIVGLRLLSSYRFDFSFDDDGFTYKGVRYSKGDIKAIDCHKWEKKSIFYIVLKDKKIALDGWHHIGVKEALSSLSQKTNS